MHVSVYAALWFLWKPFINFSFRACGADKFLSVFGEAEYLFFFLYFDVSVTVLREEKNLYKASLT